jgi:hypothetical protein
VPAPEVSAPTSTVTQHCALQSCCGAVGMAEHGMSAHAIRHPPGFGVEPLHATVSFVWNVQ